MFRTKPNENWKFPNGVYYWHDEVQIDPNSDEGQQIIRILNQQHTQKNPNPIQYGVACVKFDIHCEDGASKIDVLLSASDFELLKQDTHIMAVINIVKNIIGTPTITYNDLGVWIIEHSYYVPPNFKK